MHRGQGINARGNRKKKTLYLLLYIKLSYTNYMKYCNISYMYKYAHNTFLKNKWKQSSETYLLNKEFSASLE